MSFEEWQARNTVEYRGYSICSGFISRGGEIVFMYPVHLGEEHRAEDVRRGEQIIDDLEDRRCEPY